MDAFIQALADLAEGIGGAVVSVFSSVGQIFFTIGENGAMSGLTPIGLLLLAPFVIGLVWKVVNIVRSAVKLGGRN